MTDTTALHPVLSITGASCQGCARKIRTALEPLTGSQDLVEVDLQAQTVALPDGTDRGRPPGDRSRFPGAGAGNSARDQLLFRQHRPVPKTGTNPERTGLRTGRPHC